MSHSVRWADAVKKKGAPNCGSSASMAGSQATPAAAPWASSQARAPQMAIFEGETQRLDSSAESSHGQ